MPPDENSYTITLKNIEDGITHVGEVFQNLKGKIEPNVTPVSNLATALESLHTAASKFNGKTISASAIEKALPTFSNDFKTKISNLKNVTEPFKELGGALENISSTIKGSESIANNFKSLSISLGEIKNFATELKTTVDEVKPSDGSGATNKNLTLFSSFSQIVEVINGAVSDQSKLDKFKTIATSLRSFTSSLKAIVDFSKNYETLFKPFIDKLASQNSDSTKDALVKFINSFVPSKDADLTQLSENVKKMNDIVAVVKKYVNAISGLRSTGSSSADVPTEWNNSRQAFYNFIRGFGEVDTGLEQIKKLSTFVSKYTSVLKSLNNLGKEGVVDTKKWDATRQAFYDFIRGFGLEGDVPESLNRLGTLTKAVGKYLSEIKSLTNTGNVSQEDIDKWNTTRLAFYNFIRGFGIEGDIPEALERFGTLTKAVGKYLGEIKSLTRTGDVKKEDIDKWDKTRLAFYNFIRGFGLEGDIPDALNRLDTLTKSLGKYVKILAMLKNTGGVSQEDVKKWNDTRLEFYNFLRGFGTDGDIPDALSRINRLMAGIYKYAQVLTVLQRIGVVSQEDIKKWNDTRLAFYDFLRGFGIGGTVPDAIANINKLMAGIYKYSVVLSTLQRVGEINQADTNKWEATRKAIVKFIEDFGAINSTTLDDSATRINNLMKGLAKYADVIRTLQRIGGVDSTATGNWETTRKAVEDFIKKFASSGTQSDKDLDNAAERANTLMRGLAKYTDAIRGLQKVGEVKVDPNLNTVKAWKTTQDAVMAFIKGFKATNGSQTDKDIDEGAQRLNTLMKGLVKYADSIRGLNKIGEVNVNTTTQTVDAWTKTKDAVLVFIQSFASQGTVKDDAIDNAAKRIDTLMKGLSKYANTLNTLQKVGKVSLSDLKKWVGTRNLVTQFIESFIPTDPNAEKQLNKGAELVQKIGLALQKFASVFKTMANLGTFDPKTMATNLQTFIGEIANVVKDPAIQSITKDIQKKFSSIATAFKSISSFINSFTSKSFVNFSANLTKAIPEIENFINRMAALAKLPSFAEFERVANAVGKFKDKLHDVTEQVKRSSAVMNRFKAILRQIYTAFVGGAVIYSIVRSIKSAIKAMFDLEYAMARVNTIARVDSETLKTMTHQVQEMSATYGVESSKVSKALYDINSATIKGAASMKILEQSMKLAVAGFTDVEKVSDLIAKAVNAYQYSASEAAKISDILFVTVERGINPMEELSEYFGRLFTVSANAGVKLEEIAAGLATLTARGYQTNVASTALNSAILKLSTGTKELNKLFQQYGYASSASALRTIGLSGALGVLNKATGGATEKLHDLGFNYRDIRAATTLASGALAEYNKTLDMMTDENYTANKTAEALAKVQDTVKFKFDQLKATFVVFVQTISEYVDKNKTIKTVLDGLASGITNLTNAMRGMNLTLKEQLSVGVLTLLPKIIITFGLISTFAPMVGKIGLALPKIGKAFVLLSKSIHGSTLAFKGFLVLSKPFATILGQFMIFQGVLETISRLIKSFDAGTFWSGLADLFGFDSLAQGDLVGAFIKTPLANLAGVLGSVIDTITGFTTDFGSMWRNAIKPPDYKDTAAMYHNEQYQALLTAAQPNISLPFEELRSLIKSVAVENNISKDVLDEFLHNLAKREVSSAVTKAVTQLKNFKIAEENYSVEQLDAVYDKLRNEVAEVADTVGISSDEFNELIKRLNSEKEGVEGVIKGFQELMPNAMALKDVFEESTKSISENSEKYAGELQKMLQKMNVAQEAKTALSQELGMSPDEIESYFSNPVNFEKFKEIIKSGAVSYAEGLNEKLASVVKDFSVKPEDSLKSFLSKSMSDDASKQKLASMYSVLFGQIKGYVPGYGEDEVFNVDNMINLIKENTEKFLNFVKDYGMTGDVYDQLRDVILNQDTLNGENLKEFYSSFADNIVNTLIKTGDVNPEESKALKEKWSKEIAKDFDKIMEQPMLLMNIIGDDLDSISAKGRKAITDLAGSIDEADKYAVKFTKSMVSFGDNVNRLASQNYSVSDILQNKLKLPEVDFFKRQIMRSLGVSEENGNLDIALGNMVEYMKQQMPAERIKKEIANTLKSMGIIDIGMSDSDAETLVDSLFDPLQNMFKLSEDFQKKFKELDVIKFLNELDYGTEISGFEKYKKVGSKLIDSLKSTMIQLNGTVKGQQDFGALFNEFRGDLEKGLGFDEAQKKFVEKYGSDAFELFYTKFKEYQGLVKEFVTKVSEADFTKLLNKMQFGSEMSAFKQYTQVDSKKIADIMQRELIDGTGLIFEDAFNELARNTKTLGVTGAREKFKNEHGEEALIQLDNLTKEFDTVWSGSSYSLMQSNKNLKKKIHTFLKNFADSFLTPIQQFDKTEAILKKQLAKIKGQMDTKGYVNPELTERALENIEKLQKLNEETMNMKVPASITASEAVRTGSKEAFDLVATNIFRDTYKVNVQQKKLQDELVKQAKKLNSYLTDSNNTLKVITMP